MNQFIFVGKKIFPTKDRTETLLIQFLFPWFHIVKGLIITCAPWDVRDHALILLENLMERLKSVVTLYYNLTRNWSIWNYRPTILKGRKDKFKPNKTAYIKTKQA